MAVDTDELRRLAHDCAEDGLHTVAEQLRADADEIDRLRRWKAEAIEVLTKWDAVHQALGSPARPGQSIAAASKHEAERLREALTSTTRCLRGLCLERWETRYGGPDEPGPCCFDAVDAARALLSEDGES